MAARSARVLPELGEADLLGLQGGVPEGEDLGDLVAVPLDGLCAARPRIGSALPGMCAIMSVWWTAFIAARFWELKASSPCFISASRCAHPAWSCRSW